jgi:enterochelin esterase-like enzyme
MTRPAAGQLLAALLGAVLGAACTVAVVLLARPARAFLSELAHLAGHTPKVGWVDTDRRTPSGTLYRTFYSPTARTNVSYLIYLPPGYAAAPERRYPVIYWLHGRGGTQEDGAGDFVPRMDAAIRSGKVPPLIIVLPNGLGFNRWSDTPDGQQPVESIFIQELLPHIDHAYRTKANRQNRAIEGFSMGGFGAAHLGFKYPELFGAVALDSAALFDESEDDGYLNANSPWNLATRNADAIRGRTAIRMAVGEKDSLLDLNRNYHLLLGALGIQHQYAVLPGVAHNEERLYQRLGAQLGSFYADAFGGAQPVVRSGDE